MAFMEEVENVYLAKGHSDSSLFVRFRFYSFI